MDEESMVLDSLKRQLKEIRHDVKQQEKVVREHELELHNIRDKARSTHIMRQLELKTVMQTEKDKLDELDKQHHLDIHHALNQKSSCEIAIKKNDQEKLKLIAQARDRLRKAGKALRLQKLERQEKQDENWNPGFLRNKVEGIQKRLGEFLKCKFESTASGFSSTPSDSLMSTYTQEKPKLKTQSITSDDAEQDDFVPPIEPIAGSSEAQSLVSPRQSASAMEPRPDSSEAQSLSTLRQSIIEETQPSVIRETASSSEESQSSGEESQSSADESRLSVASADLYSSGNEASATPDAILPVLMSPAFLDKEITENSILGVTDIGLLNNTANDSKILPESALIGFTSWTDGENADENMNTMEV